MAWRVWALLAAVLLAGCSPTTSALTGPAPETSVLSLEDEAPVPDGEEPVERPARRKVASAPALEPASPRPVRTRVASVSPDGSAFALAPAAVEDDRARLVRVMEERDRRWQAAARRAVRSICSGC